MGSSSSLIPPIPSFVPPASEAVSGSVPSSELPSLPPLPIVSPRSQSRSPTRGRKSSAGPPLNQEALLASGRASRSLERKASIITDGPGSPAAPVTPSALRLRSRSPVPPAILTEKYDESEEQEKTNEAEDLDDPFAEPLTSAEPVASLESPESAWVSSSAEPEPLVSASNAETSELNSESSTDVSVPPLTSAVTEDVGEDCEVKSSTSEELETPTLLHDDVDMPSSPEETYHTPIASVTSVSSVLDHNICWSST